MFFVLTMGRGSVYSLHRKSKFLSLNENAWRIAMKKIFTLALLMLALTAAAPGQAQAASCMCKGTLLMNILCSIWGCDSDITCTGGTVKKGKGFGDVTDDKVRSVYLKHSQNAINVFNEGGEGYDNFYSGWSCKK